MGMFDSYHVPWGDRAVEIHTHQYNELLDCWTLGDRIPMGDWDSQSCDNSWAAGQDLSDPAWLLLEDASFDCFAPETALLRRYFALAHWHGVFADCAAGLTEDQAEAHAQALRRVWTQSPCSPGLALHLSRIVEAKRQSQLSVAEGIAQIDAQFLRWRAHRQEVRFPPATPKRGFGPFYCGPDFSGQSRRALVAAFERLSHRMRASLEFDLPKSPAEPSDDIERFVTEFAATSNGLFGHRRRLGSPAPLDLAPPPPPDENPSPARAIARLRAGQWREFERDARALSGDPQFLAAAREGLADICHSRIGAQWAAAAMAANPALAFDSMELGSETVPLMDWLVARMGLPTRLALPLLDAGVAASPALAHYCLAAPHAALFEPALDRAALALGTFEGATLAQRAALCSNFEALQAIDRKGGLDLPSDQRDLLMVAVFSCAHSCAQRAPINAPPWNSANSTGSASEAIASLPAELAALNLLLDKGWSVPSSISPFPHWGAFAALREQAALSSVALAPASRKPGL